MLACRPMTSPSSFNNYWGVPLTLCDASPEAGVWVVEMGMNQTGEITRLSEIVRPTSADRETSSRCIWNSSPASKRSPTTRRSISQGAEPGGAVRAQPRQFEFARLEAKRKPASRASSVRRGRKIVMRGCSSCFPHAVCSAVHANILGHDITYKIGMPGRHMAMNSLAVLAGAMLLGADLRARRCRCRSRGAGRPRRAEGLEVGNGEAT